MWQRIIRTRTAKPKSADIPLFSRTKTISLCLIPEITIDKDDNISIRLPKNRLLDFADRTTITVFNTENQTAATGLNIFVTDNNGNNATGVTDENGQFIAPDKKSSTGDDNGTIGKEDGDSKLTYVIKVTDKAQCYNSELRNLYRRKQ